MPMSPYVRALRERVGHDLLLLPAVTAVIQRDDRFLLCRRAGAAEWGLIGGGVEPGEEPHEALSREVLEELGVHVDVLMLLGVYGGRDLVVRYDNGDRVSYVTTAYLCAIPLEADLTFVDGELVETGWFTIEQISALPHDDGMDRILSAAVDRPHASRDSASAVADEAEPSHTSGRDADAVDPLAVAERFVAARYPHATIAIVAGSTARGERTTSSDIDLLLIGDALFEDTSTTSEASTHEFAGEVFEVFAYTRSGFVEWAERGVAQHRPVTVHMLVEGTPIRADSHLAALRETWQRVLDAGPTLGDQESRFRRYVITDVLDDLEDASDPLEKRVEASILFERTAELMLLTAGRWIATGKWLPRRLRDLDPERADRLSAPLLQDDYAAFAARVAEELERAGGRVQAGFVR